MVHGALRELGWRAFRAVRLLVACQGKQRPFGEEAASDSPSMSTVDSSDAGGEFPAASQSGEGGAMASGNVCEPGLECGCEAGTMRCSADGSAVERCDANATWQLVEVCEGTQPICVAGRCAICQPGQRECLPTGPASCAADGAAWIADAPCTGATPICVPEMGVCSSCSPGSVRPCPETLGDCSSGQQTCDANGNWGDCSVLPAETDSCDPGRDENCNGIPNEGCDCTDAVACGPAALGECQPGQSECVAGALGPCVGAALPAQRDCSSPLDNNCDGRADNELDATCQCIPSAVEACDTHPGRDGIGICRAGSRTCVETSANTASLWSACQGAVPPRSRDCRSNLDNDCDGVADNRVDDTCQCAPGSTRPCGSPQADGCPLLQQVQQCAVLANGSSTRWDECTFEAGDGRLCEPRELATGVELWSVAAVDQFAYFIDVDGIDVDDTPELWRVPARGGDPQFIAGPGLGRATHLRLFPAVKRTRKSSRL